MQVLRCEEMWRQMSDILKCCSTEIKSWLVKGKGKASVTVDDVLGSRHLTDAKGCLKRRMLKHCQNCQLDDALG